MSDIQDVWTARADAAWRALDHDTISSTISLICSRACCHYDPSEEKLRQTTQVHLIRCLFGNPSRQDQVEAEWLRWNDGAVVKLAQSIYDQRAFEDLPILADALEEAGCDNPAFLDHCRGEGPHALGCWVLDLILGYE